MTMTSFIREINPTVRDWKGWKIESKIFKTQELFGEEDEQQELISAAHNSHNDTNYVN